MKDKQKLLVIGSGGREHAIAKKLLASPHVAQVFCAPGNPGMVEDGIVTLGISELDFEALKGFCYEEEIDWTFVLSSLLRYSINGTALNRFSPS